MRYLVTGGAGFIGSHLCDRLVADGHDVLVLDDLSSGRSENLAGLLGRGRLELVHGTVTDRRLVLRLLQDVDACAHLASVVGVARVLARPVDTLLTNVRGTDVVLSACAALGRRVLYTSTSEVYGKRSDGPLAEGADRVLGPPQTARWNYSTSKAFGEALALGLHREVGAETVVARLFNAVGPRQTGAYGMVLPRFVRQALDGEPLTVYGDGTQTRCFTHVLDTVEALVRLLGCDAATGRVLNVGTDAETSIAGLARRVGDRAGVGTRVRFIPFAEAYDEGFEERGTCRPDVTLLRRTTGWQPRRTLDEAIDDVIACERAARERERSAGLAR